jgi:AcrR family transcriptional regulator
MTLSIDNVNYKVKGSIRVKSLTEAERTCKRNELVELATEILERDGFQGLTLRKLAAEGGISRTTPYLYFADKADLLEEICIATFDRLIATGVQETAAQVTFLDKLTALGRMYLQFGLDHPILYRLTFAPETPGDRVSPRLQERIDRYRAVAEEPMQKGCDAGYFNLPPARLNMVLWAGFHGLLCLKWAGHLPSGTEFEQVREDLEKMLAFGFFNRQKLAELKILDL